ncbi:FAD-dependent oxidoreductase [Spirulina major CS-329]|uniref:NAD(P)/FAD-dependent oxidoreductase n=1 Tax=Spirulina TaxID=1154 RepID=UPI00232FA8E0|nr:MULTISPECIES: FAD-dependent oxidoreductase [Spirulina]MDB9493583.1 FAD-dependent oxidoreductase [Spirulina subsalsa CS-330]MDB9505478.1 FAD-dependent oxidoreductase [Spirulina major CS-329]
MNPIVIVGGGVVGAMIAYELNRQKQAVVLVEQASAAAGSTGAALGVLMGVISQKTTGRGWRLREQSLRRYATLIPELEQVTGCPIPTNSHGLVMLRFREDERDERWQRLQQVRSQQGWSLELWDRAQLAAHCPYIESDRLIGAVHSPQDGQIQPRPLTAALIQAASQAGADCRFGQAVTALRTEAEGEAHRCTHVQIGTDWLACDRLILAAGLGSTPLTAQLQQTLDLRPVLGQAFRVRCPAPLHPVEPVISGHDVHLVPLGGGDYWVGATVEFPDEQGIVAAQAHLKAAVWQQAIAVCPALAQGEIIESWSGQRPRPHGQPAPVIGPLTGYTNVTLATGHYRNGVLLAPATAQQVCAEIVR